MEVKSEACALGRQPAAPHATRSDGTGTPETRGQGSTGRGASRFVSDLKVTPD